MKMRDIASYIGIGASAVVLATGCATSTPKAQFSQPIAPASLIAAKDEAKVKVEAAADVQIMKTEMAMLAERIEMKIAGRQIGNRRDGEKKTYEVNLLLTRYEKGSAFARAMLAGLGQIHIDGEVTLFEMPAKNQVGKFTINKTFAWGGIYGGTTSMETIEQTFADGIAAALTGQQEEQKKEEK